MWYAEWDSVTEEKNLREKPRTSEWKMDFSYLVINNVSTFVP